MSESVIADFVGKFNATLLGRAEPASGRVLLSQKRLVLATDDGKATVPLSQVFDVAVGHVPSDLGEFFDSTVTVAFNKNDARHVAAIEADGEKVEKFATVLYKALLNGTTLTVKHPARVGGRVTGEEFHPARLFLKPKRVEFRGQDDSFRVDLSTVTSFERTRREVGGSDREVLAIRHMRRGQAVTSLAAVDSSRKMGLLGRYLRLEYGDIVEELKNVNLSGDETELLVTIYSTGPDVSLATVLGAEATEVEMLLEKLLENGLVTRGSQGPELTAKGRIVVSDKLEDVNV